ncbi:MAG: insulinase family protein [Spirochaetes bacterium]|nr:insulinase family protein [Spirochaetota bacterium]
MKKYAIHTIILFLLAIVSIPANAQIKDVGEYLKANTVHKKMKNGINVIMLNRGYSPILAMTITFRAGSVDESYNNMGIAHMLEHMLFKGTDKIGTTDFKKEKPVLEEIEKTGEMVDRLTRSDPENPEIEKLKTKLKNLQQEERQYIVSTPYSRIYTQNGGVGFNASTSKDMTAYYIELPSSKLELWANLESERLRNPVFREFYLEKGAVYEERLMRYESQGEGSLFEKFLSIAYIAHPYRHPVIGWKSNIKNYTVKQVRDFYRENYVPSRMTIAIVGRQDTDITFKMLEKYFSTLEDRKAPPETVITEPEQKGERRFEIEFESNPYLLIGWHKPTFPSKTDYVFDVISGILTQGKTSRLYHSLVMQKGIAASVQAYNGYPGSIYDNLFIIAGVPKNPATAEELEKAIYEEMNKLADDVTEDEIRKIIINMESSYVFDMDNNMGIARLLSYYQTNFGRWQYAVDYLNVLRTVTVNDVKQTIKEYLIRENRTVGILKNTKNK